MDDSSCWSCGCDVELEDKFCRHCGQKSPGAAVTWDWKEQPCFGAINELLEPFGCEIVELDTRTDQYGIRVQEIKKGGKP